MQKSGARIGTRQPSRGKRIHIRLPDPYLARVDDRARTRGIDRAEAVRQLIDEAHNAGSRSVRNHLVNEMRGGLNEIALAAAALKLRFQRTDGEATEKFRIIEQALQRVGALVEAMPAC